MKKEKTERGFGIVKFKDYYNQSCKLQNSSLAMDDCIWLGISDPNPIVMASQAEEFGIETEETTGFVDFPIPKEVIIHTTMHLSREQVAELLPYLHKFVDTGTI